MTNPNDIAAELERLAEKAHPTRWKEEADLFTAYRTHHATIIAALRAAGEVDQTGWLVERNDLGSPRWLCFGPKHRDTTYTTDANKALRFARKEDAEAAMFHLENNDPVLRVTEHKWIARRALGSAKE